MSNIRTYTILLKDGRTARFWWAHHDIRAVQKRVTKYRALLMDWFGKENLATLRSGGITTDIPKSEILAITSVPINEPR